MRAVSLIEPLEDRIAPASVVSIASNGRTATYSDANGDRVVVTTTKGAFTTAQFTFDPSTPGQLTELSLANTPSFNGANLTFTVFPVNGPNGGSDVVNVGYLDAIGINLAAVTIPGDLGRIDIGGGPGATALGKLTIKSLGALSSTQGGLTLPSGAIYDTASNITGTIGQVNVAGNLDGTLFAQDYLNVPGTGNIGQLNVGGSIDGNVEHLAPGGSTYFYTAGQVFFTGSLGTAVIGGGIEGGPENYSGTIGGYASNTGGLGTFSKIGSITVKGAVPDDPNPNPEPGVPGTSIFGGTGNLSGGIIADTVGTVNIAGDVTGNTGAASGFVEGALSLHSVNIAGSLAGGNLAQDAPSGANSAGVVFGGSVGTVTIGEGIYGGSGVNSGEILSTGTIQKVVVMGSVYGGAGGTSTTSGFSGSIRGHVLDSVTVMGSVIGGNLVAGNPSQTANGSGVISSDTSIGSVYIGGDVIGGSGISSGQILANAGNAGSITVAGAHGLVGGSGQYGGYISVSGALGKLTLAHDLTGGSGEYTGYVEVGSNLSKLTIGGSVTGGTADSTGSLAIFGALGTGQINGSITGGNSGAALLSNTGYLEAGGITNLSVAGSLVAGTAGSGVLDTSGAIRSTAAIGSLTIGNLKGNATNPAIISAVGPANVTFGAASDVAIGKLTITGYSVYGDILAGYSADTQNSTALLGTGVNANAQIGTVTIGGNLTATNIIAGVGAGTNGFFGNAGSAALTGSGVSDLPSIVSKISRIIIGGVVTAPTVSTTDTFGIAAQQIVSASVHGTPLHLTAGPDNDTFANDADQPLLTGGNGDVTLYEV